MNVITTSKGKRRTVALFNIADKFVLKLLDNAIKDEYESIFHQSSFAFQDNKGIQDAADLARVYMENGNEIIVSVDLKDYFEHVDLEIMMSLLKGHICSKLNNLLSDFLYMKVNIDGEIIEKTVGLIQGAPTSPVLSNIYLHVLDDYMQKNGYKWLRFADDINIFVNDQDEAIDIFNAVFVFIRSKLKLGINEEKSGVFSAYDKPFLGYDFIKHKEYVEIRKHKPKKMNIYRRWHDTVIEKVNHEYHIVKDGVLTKKDYSFLFETDDGIHHLPVEPIDQLNIYGEVSISSSVLNMLAKNDICVSFVDEYGEPIGSFVPQKHNKNARVLLEQCRKYIDDEVRIRMAREMEEAGFHNMRSNLRIYNKKQDIDLNNEIQEISEAIDSLTNIVSVSELMLEEARVRQRYYMAFNKIIANEDFAFIKRSKMPPLDPINALISFCNTLLYNEFSRIISMYSLDLRIGIIHSSNKRLRTLNLDFADLFKPIISDRVIFSLINKKIITLSDFEASQEKTLLNVEGKRRIINEFEAKLSSTLTIDGNKINYRQLMINEIKKYQKFIVEDVDYKPYKYY